MFAGHAVKVIDREECDIEPAHAVEKLEYGHFERTCVQRNPLHPFTGEQAAEEKIPEQSGAKVTCHARIEYAVISLAPEPAVMLIGKSLDHHPLLQVWEIAGEVHRIGDLVSYKIEFGVLFKEGVYLMGRKWRITVIYRAR